QAHLRGFVADLAGDLVGLLDLQLTRDDLLADIGADGVEDRPERLLVDAGGDRIRVRVCHASAQSSSTMSETASAIAAGRSWPSISMTWFMTTWMPVSFRVTSLSVTTSRTFEPTRTGLGKRTLLRP